MSNLRRLVTATAAAALALGASSGCQRENMAHPILESTTARAVLDGVDDPRVVEAPTTPATGASQPLVVVTIFEDFECVHCARMRGFGERVARTWLDTVQVQYRQLPLFRAPSSTFPRGMHVRSRAAARAALAAHLQGQFSAYRTRLFRSQSHWAVKRGDKTPDPNHDEKFEEHLVELAKEIGLDIEKFEADFKSEAVARRVDEDVLKANSIGARSTPSIMINGRRHDVRNGFRGAARIIREELRAAEQLSAERQMKLPANADDATRAKALADIPIVRARQAAEHPDFASVILLDQSP